MRELLPFILIVACPLAMIFMMRGMHGQGGKQQAEPKLPREEMSIDQLKHERDELNELIGARAEQIVHARGSRREAPR
ncbi:MAG TPA: DUF2933 domain-containing protein [Gaiellaceae bacterium]|nr:DUF2933 domain-containing protein [Gaiellaceae bacterium]